MTLNPIRNKDKKNGIPIFVAITLINQGKQGTSVESTKHIIVNEVHLCLSISRPFAWFTVRCGKSAKVDFTSKKNFE